MRSVLSVSIAFPPKFDSEGLQVAKYYKYLVPESQGRFHLDVVTSRVPTLNMPYDASLEGATQGLRQTVALPIFENKYSNYLLRHLWPTLAHSPDSKFTFHWQWRRVVSQLKEKPSLIYSRSFPPSSAVMARKLKRHWNIPWIMHLSDPWADSPHIDFRGGSQQYNQRLERQCFEEADVICATSHGTLEFFANKYPELKKRYEFFPNVYDPDDIPEHRFEPPTSDRKIRLVHTGGLAGSRSPEAFLRGVAGLAPELQERLEIVFAGHTDRLNRAVLRKYDIDCFTYVGPLDTYRDALELQRWSDVLVLIDFPVEREDLRVYFLSKLLDYQITGKPILALTDTNSECQRFIESGLGHSIERRDSEGVTRYLEWLTTAEPEYFKPRATRPEYDAAYNAKRLMDLFEEVAAD